MSTTAYMTLNRAQQRLPHGHSGVTTIASSVCGPPQSCHLLRTTTSGGAWGVTSGDRRLLQCLFSAFHFGSRATSCEHVPVSCCWCSVDAFTVKMACDKHTWAWFRCCHADCCIAYGLTVSCTAD